jgi:alginate O-acetyltransferase complex protein AlgI
MVFTEFRFVLFFAIAFAVYWALRANTARKWWLLACSFAFYGAWDWRFLTLLWIATGLDYFAGLGLARFERPALRRAILTVSLAANLGMLGVFKYCGFFVGSAQELCSWLGLPFQTGSLNIILPVGISFYTFQSLSYTIDVYRRQVPATRSLLDFALYVAFFPQLVAGPIVRGRDFLPQLHVARRWDWARLHLGVEFFVMGLVKKLVIGDRMALFADPVFSNPEGYQTGALWMAALAFMLQVYGDFSGYSDMAVGTAHMLGYKLCKNFDMPYLSRNISEFWRRWHISLSTWLRDYLYVPLGGKNESRARSDRNLLLTMTLCGLWHGAAWTYVIFGALQGCLLVGHRRFRDLCKSRPRLVRFLESPLGTVWRVTFTFFIFGVSLVIFRAATLEDGLTMLGRMFWPADGFGAPMNDRALWYVVIFVALCHAAGAYGLWRKWGRRLPAPLQGAGYAVAATAALVLAPELGKAFVYFQF